MAKPLEKFAPWMPPSAEDNEVAAMQALAKGAASMDQQERALDWIINKAAATYDLPYRPGGVEGERDTIFALGRLFVGQQIVKLLKLKLGQPRGQK